MKNFFKSVKAQNSRDTTSTDQNLFSCGSNENSMYQPWNVSGQRIANIVRDANGTPSTGSIALKSDLKDYLQKGDITTTGTFLRTAGGLMIGNINMGGSSTVVGLPTSYKTSTVNSTDMASVGMVSEDIGALANNVTDLINRINDLVSTNGLDKLIEDLGTPEGDKGTLKNPQNAKWLVRGGGNSMQGDLGFKKSEQSAPTDLDPTIKNLIITGGTTKNRVTAALGAVSTGTGKENLQRILAVKDVLETVAGISQHNSLYPNWSGMEIPFVSLKQTSNGSSTPNYEKSRNSENYITTTDNSSVTLLRRGIYLVSFIYDFSQSTVTSPGISPSGYCRLSGDSYPSETLSLIKNPALAAANVSCSLSLTPNGGAKKECYKIEGKSDSTLIGNTYIFVEGSQASVSTILSFDVTSSPAVTTRTWTVSFIGAAY
ncbi:cell wall associated hydrolases [Chlamydia felis Fe/C-56]|uniref:Cell wall associated hydrolases n=1 Tax=Chlamydia felis (strain Fe/C-56) TaxID=264202 RepID=Q254C5_CHLFF|nr:hypothetical protein [Chlamydia felis]BAE81363.1 cell wall associated hydrolases [Chlamydia felis Fe/C-56]